jgi:hypothetical protein
MSYIGSCISFVSNAVRQAAQVIFPVAVNTAIDAGLQDERIGKIVGGVSLIFTGIGAIIASGVPKRLAARFISTKEDFSPESVQKTALRYGAAFLGLLSTCYGVYNVAMGVMELMKMNEDPKKVRSEENSSSIACIGGALKRNKEQILRCPEIQNLWNKVKADGSFTLCNSELPWHGEAYTLLEKRMIIIDPRTSSRKINYDLVFELNNLKQSKEALLLFDYRCKMSPNQFARSIEKVEYQSSVETQNIIHDCQNRGVWKWWSDSYNCTSFGDYFWIQENLGDHTDQIRRRWHQACDLKKGQLP